MKSRDLGFDLTFVMSRFRAMDRRMASLLLDGKQSSYSPYTVRGQQKQFAEEGTEQRDGGWYIVPGKVDRISYYLLLLFAASLLFLYLFNALID